jgi:hypothetical protein
MDKKTVYMAVRGRWFSYSRVYGTYAVKDEDMGKIGMNEKKERVGKWKWRLKERGINVVLPQVSLKLCLSHPHTQRERERERDILSLSLSLYISP